MLKVLFCFSCCGSPPSSRPARGKAGAVKSNEKLIEEANFRSLLPLGEKDQLLANQIQANNDNYGAKEADQSGKNTLTTKDTTYDSLRQQQNRQQSQNPDDDSLQASTSSPRQTFVPKLGADSKTLAPSDEINAAYRAGESLDLYDEDSISAQSSIDIESFKENPNAEQMSSDNTALNDNHLTAISNRRRQLMTENTSIYHSSSASPIATGEATSTTDVPADDKSAHAINQKTITSTTKIGDYARLEYSPVEDLESVTTYSYSRGGSEKGGRGLSGANSTVSRQSSVKTSGNVSRRSSQGIESTSISIASQLSNEQLQQNLTNMLESANSPAPLFGTIGLPLGPPLDNMTSETAKTSPETTGAALTSASQDSLSSMDSTPASRTATVGSASIGAALVNDSIEDSSEMAELTRNLAESNFRRARLAESEDALPPARSIDSPLSIATTTSGGLTNPTPTPSEISAGGTKKRSKLRPAKLLKKLRPGSKKNSKDKANNP